MSLIPLTRIHELLNSVSLDNMSKEELVSRALDRARIYSSENWWQRLRTDYYFSQQEFNKGINEWLEPYVNLPPFIKEENKGFIAFTVAVATGGGTGAYLAKKYTSLFSRLFPTSNTQKMVENFTTGTGAMLGGGGAAVAFLLSMEKTQTHASWKNEKLSLSVTDYINGSFKSDIFLSLLLCPTTTLIIEIPGKFNDRYVEYSSIPASHKNGVNPDYILATTIQKRILLLLNEIFKNKHKHDPDYEPFQNMIATTQGKIEKYFNLSEEYVANLKKNDKNVDFAFFLSERNRSDLWCGRNPNEALDWLQITSALNPVLIAKNTAP